MPANGDPSDGAPFRWRVSVAHVDRSGPFSDFAGYNRKMVLLRGSGIELRFADGERKSLRQVGDLVEFDGAASVHCELLNGPCVDLNLMVSKADGVSARVERFHEPIALSAALAGPILILPIDREITLALDTGENAMLEPWDLALLSRGDARIAKREPTDAVPPAAAAASVFLAAFKH